MLLLGTVSSKRCKESVFLWKLSTDLAYLLSYLKTSNVTDSVCIVQLKLYLVGNGPVML